MTTNCSSTGMASGHVAVPQKLRLPTLSSQVSVLWSEGMGFGNQEPMPYVNSPRVKVCMELVEGVRHDLPYCGKARCQGSVEKAYLFSQ